MTKKEMMKYFKTKADVDKARWYVCERQVEAEMDDSAKAIADVFWYGMTGYKDMTKAEAMEQLWWAVEDMEDFEAEEFINNQVLHPK